ncbi:short coiled-coil protein isoform X3 [Cervus canadensis]|uniref:short coiled-coil protein isoform X3 n=1 Tax=Cervus canadensis TaxID=1574408 RepID=UPI001C9E7790|nr:short coiled-coil protein isoform X3 [Cervus canadensis]
MRDSRFPLPSYLSLTGLKVNKMDGSAKEEEEDRAFTNISLADDTDHSSRILYPRHRSLLPKMMNADMDAVDAENQVELEEKTRLINQVLELQHTLEGPALLNFLLMQKYKMMNCLETDCLYPVCKFSYVHLHFLKHL